MKRGNAVSIIYLSTFQKEIRSKTFWFILGFTGLVLWLLIAFSQNSSLAEFWGYMQSSTALIFFSLLMFWSYVLAAVFSVGLIRSDVEEGTLKQLLSFPLGRWEYLSARFLGGVSLVFFYHVLSTLAAGTWAFYGTISFERLLLFVLMTIPGIFSIVVCGMIFSLFFNRIISLFFIFLWGLAESWSALVVGKIPWMEVGIPGMFGHAFYWLFPHGALWSEQATRLLPPFKESLDVNWVFESGHFCLSFALLFVTLIVIFRYRDV